MNPKDIHANMVARLEDDKPALTKVQVSWRGMECLEDEPRSGHPATTITGENTDRVLHILMNYRQLAINQTVNAILNSIKKSL